jgi:hypothetical protein
LTIVYNIIVEQSGVMDHLHDSSHVYVVFADNTATAARKQYQAGSEHFAGTSVNMVEQIPYINQPIRRAEALVNQSPDPVQLTCNELKRRNLNPGRIIRHIRIS